jgi:transposase-like protein
LLIQRRYAVPKIYPKIHAVAKSPNRDIATELDTLLRAKSSELLQHYIEIEVEELLARKRYERRATGASVAYRDGHDPERTIATGGGPLTFRRPRVRGTVHVSALVPPYRRRLPVIDATLHKLWVEGLAHRDFEPALRVLFGAQTPLSPSTIARVNAEYLASYDAWKRRSLAHEHFIYIWVDGIFLGIGPGDERRVILVVIGADADGEKHLLALEDAMSESEISWTEVLGDLKARGLRAPELIIGDGAEGLWNAAAVVFGDAKQQRCWFHKIKNVGDKIPAKRRPEVHGRLREIMYAATEKDARAGIETLACELQAEYPKAAACLRDDVDRMVTYYKFPSERWKHLRTTNPIESIFATVRLRTDAAKRLRTGRSATYLLHALIDRMSGSWRRLQGFGSSMKILTEAA